MATHGDDLPQLQRALQALQQMRARLEALQQARSEPIAVVGMACRFPGGAGSPEAFWRLLVEARDGITEVPADRWDAAALYDPEVEAPGKMATRWGGFIEEVDRFDPAFFGIAPREAAQMDPQQRLLLEVGWEALESAGESLERLRGSATGVFVGVHSHSSDYGLLQMRELEDVGTYTSTGTAHSIVANRLSYWLDLRGPSLAVDTACSSSLVAAHLAVQSLRARECDLALAGGVNLLLTPEVTVALSRMRMMAADGRCKTFDAAADGFVRGEGCGVIVLKRLSDALAGNDPILAVIAGSATNQDGATNGLTAPSGLAQREVVRRALADGKVDPARVTFVETHGTGTALGDPIEVEALAEVLGRSGDAPCLLGAVKSNLGHLEGAAGIAGLIKAVLALRHETIPPNLHFREPNPHLTLAGTRFAIPTAARPWPAGTERHAGVSSFGFGGTNAHLVLREYTLTPRPPLPHAGEAENSVTTRPQPLVISGHTPEALDAFARSYRELLAGEALPLADVCYTAAVRRTHHPHRLAVVGETPGEMAGALAAYLAGDRCDAAARGHADPDARRRLVFVFSGQGSQWPGMGRSLLEQEPVFREKLAECDALLRPLAGWSLLAELAAPAERSRLDETEVTQPVLFAMQVALAELWRSRGIVPDAVVGHSAGEVAAAHVAGALDLEQAIRVIHHRGRVMQPASGAGRMAAVGLSRSGAEAFLADRAGVSLAAVNGPSSAVLSGEVEAVEAAVAELTERGVFARVLPVSLASHSVQMEPLSIELVRSLASLSPQAPAIPLYSTVTGRRARLPDFDAGYWGRNLRDPVLFLPAIAAATEAGGTDFLEIAPHPILRTPLEQCTGDSGALVLGSLDRELPEHTALLRSLGALHTRGYAVDWPALHPAGGAVVPLPRYPWQRRRYWIETGAATRRKPPAESVNVAGVLGAATLAGRRLSSPAIQGFVFESELSAASLSFLGEHRIGDNAILPAAFYVAMLLSAGRVALRREPAGLEALAIHHPLVVPEEGSRTVHCILQPPAQGRIAVEVHSRGAEDADGWTLHATAQLVLTAAPHQRGPATLEQIRERVAAAHDDAGLSPAARSLGAGQPIVERVWQGEGEALVQLRLPDVLSPEPGSDLLHAALWDACLRLLGARGAAGGRPGRLFVVAGLDRLSLAHSLPTELLCHLQIRYEGPARDEFTGELRLFTTDGAPAGEAVGVRFAAVAPAPSEEAGREEWLYEVVWRPQGIPSHPHPRPAGAEPRHPLSMAGAGSWLIFADELGVARALAEQIRARGGECLLASGGEGGAVVREWLDAAREPAGVLYLRGLDASTQERDAESVQERVRSSCTAVADLARALLDAETTPKPRLWIATCGAQPVVEEDVTDPVQAPLWGLGRSIALECPECWGGLLDLPRGGDPAAHAEQLLAQLLSGDGEDQAAFRGGERFVPRLTRAGNTEMAPPAFHADAAYLITGGLGSLGLRLARWLAERGAGHLVLLGRTPLPDRSDWAALGAEPAAGPKVAVIREIEPLGATVTTVAADVADEEAMRRLFARFGDELPPLKGVFHTAAVMGFTPLPRLQPDQLDAVLRPKVAGSWVLHQLTERLDLDHFVLFSSVAGLWGSRGMAHYTAANQFLDALAHHRRALGLPALAVNWGGWEGGDSSRDAARFLEQSDFRLLPVEPALAMLGSAMMEGVTQRAIAWVDWASLKASYELHAGRPFLREIEIADGESDAPETEMSSEAATSLLQQLETLAEEEALSHLTSHVRGQVAEVLGLDPAQLMEPGQGFFKLGMDSLMTVELRGRLERSAGVRLPTTIAFEYPTVEALAGFLAGKLLQRYAAAQAAPSAADGQDGGVAELDLEALSEDELAAMLDGALADLLDDEVTTG